MDVVDLVDLYAGVDDRDDVEAPTGKLIDQPLRDRPERFVPREGAKTRPSSLASYSTSHGSSWTGSSQAIALGILASLTVPAPDRNGTRIGCRSTCSAAPMASRSLRPPMELSC